MSDRLIFTILLSGFLMVIGMAGAIQVAFRGILDAIDRLTEEPERTKEDDNA